MKKRTVLIDPTPHVIISPASLSVTPGNLEKNRTHNEQFPKKRMITATGYFLLKRISRSLIRSNQPNKGHHSWFNLLFRYPHATGGSA